MALKINFELETSSDVKNPLTVANAIIQESGFDIHELREVACALHCYVDRRRDQKYDYTRAVEPF